VIHEVSAGRGSGAGRAPGVLPEQAETLRRIASRVARAARVLIEQGCTALGQEDLEAVGLHAVWSKLDQHDPAVTEVSDWAFFVAIRAMQDAARGERRETAFAAAVRRGAQTCAAVPARAVPIDLHRDTLETDLWRLRARTRHLAVGGWLEAYVDAASIEPSLLASAAALEAVRIVREELARLSEEQRAYVRLRFWEGEEAEAIAARTGVPARTLRRRWSETRALLVARLAARGVRGIPEGFTLAADATAGEDAAEKDGAAGDAAREDDTSEEPGA
jgi:RNA polymerase sigma factor (sigma-70 family)